MTSHPIGVQICPFCAYKTTHSTGLYQKESISPEPGSVSLCLQCGKAAVFNRAMNLRVPTEEEKHVLNADPRIVEAQIVLAGMNFERGRNQ